MKINSLIPKNVQKTYLVVAILFLICISVVRHKNRIEENFLDGCYHVYIDLGTVFENNSKKSHFKLHRFMYSIKIF